MLWHEVELPVQVAEETEVGDKDRPSSRPEGDIDPHRVERLGLETVTHEERVTILS